MVGDDQPAGGAVIVKSFWFPLFLVIVVLTVSNEAGVTLYDAGDSKLQMGPKQVTFFLAVAVILFLALWKLLLYYFKVQKDRIEKDIIHESERHALIDIFESTGDVLPCPYILIASNLFILSKLPSTLLTQFHNNVYDDSSKRES